MELPSQVIWRLIFWICIFNYATCAQEIAKPANGLLSNSDRGNSTWQKLAELCNNPLQNAAEISRQINYMQETGDRNVQGTFIRNQCSNFGLFHNFMKTTFASSPDTNEILCKWLLSADINIANDYTNLPGNCWTETVPKLDTFTYIIIAIVSGVLLLAVLATCIHPCTKRKDPSASNHGAAHPSKADYHDAIPQPTSDTIFSIFSIHQNIRLWSNRKVDDEDHIKCVDGIRFLSICWVILLFTFLLCPTILSREIIQSYPKWSMLLILCAHFASDTFFTCSGLLLTYRTLNRLERKQSVVVPLIRRLFRFMPVYAAVIFTSATIIPFFREHNSYLQANAENCRQNWWTNLLFINNLVHSKSESTCHQETWFLAADMQFFVVTLVLVYILFARRVAGLVLIGALIGAAIAFPLVLTAENELIPSPVKLFYQDMTLEQVKNYVNFYIKPWNRAGPYLMGIIGGYILYLRKSQRHTKKFSVPVWTIPTVVALALIYGLHLSHGVDEVVRKADSAIYAGLHSLTWGCVVTWVVIACNQGMGGWISDLLGWTGFIPLARLTYCIFLVSTNVQLVFHLFQQNQASATLPSTLTMTGYFFAHLTASLVVAFVLHVIVQAPFVKMGNSATKSDDVGSHKSSSDKPRARRERYGIYYTGGDMENGGNNAGGVVVASNGVDQAKRQRPTVRYGMFYDGLKCETVIDIN